MRDRINHPLSLLKLGAHAGIIIGLIMLQGDLGSALVFMFMTAAMLYCAGLSFWYFLAAAGVIVAAAPFCGSILPIISSGASSLASIPRATLPTRAFRRS